MPAEAAELRDHRVLRKRGERPQRLEPELPQPAVRVGIERQHGDWLRSEKLRLPSNGHDYRLSGFRSRCCNPGNKLSATPPNAEFGMRSAEFQGRVVRLTTLTLTFRIPHSALRIEYIPHSAFRTPHLYSFHDPLRPPVHPFQSVGTYVGSPPLRGLADGAHRGEPSEEPRELLVVMNRIGLAQLERGTESDRLAHRHPGLHARTPGERRRLPQPGGPRVVRREQRPRQGRELGPARRLAAQREQRDPAARGGSAFQMGCSGHCQVRNGTRIYPEDRARRKDPY